MIDRQRIDIQLNAKKCVIQLTFGKIVFYFPSYMGALQSENSKYTVNSTLR